MSTNRTDKQETPATVISIVNVFLRPILNIEIKKRLNQPEVVMVAVAVAAAVVGSLFGMELC
jgi:hypothetical protein